MSVSEFEAEAGRRGLSAKSINRLTGTEQITSEQALSMVTVDELDRIPSTIISFGDKARLRGWKVDLLSTEADNGQPAGEGALVGPEPAGNQEPIVLADVFNEETTEVDIADCVEQLELPDRFKQNIKEHVEQHGMQGLIKTLTQELTEFENSPIHIAVIGGTGTGKSSVINTLRGLRPSHPKAAKVNVIETTSRLDPYMFPQHDNVRLWDLPGVNTPNYPKAEYLGKVDFHNFDAYMIITATRYSADDKWLASNVDKDKKFYFIRSKVDQDIESNERDFGRSEKETLETIREDVESNLRKAGHTTDTCFLLSGLYDNTDRWEFAALVDTLVYKTPTKDRTTMLMSVVACSSKIIRLKWQELDKRVSTVVLEAVFSGEEKYKQLLTDEVSRYTERLGLEDVQSIDNTEELNVLHACIDNLDGLLQIPLNSTAWEGWFRTGLKWLGRQIDNVNNTHNAMQVNSRRSLLACRTQDVLRQILLTCHEAAQAILRQKTKSNC